jgi:hypothetical protein
MRDLGDVQPAMQKTVMNIAFEGVPVARSLLVQS